MDYNFYTRSSQNCCPVGLYTNLFLVYICFYHGIIFASISIGNQHVRLFSTVGSVTLRINGCSGFLLSFLIESFMSSKLIILKSWYGMVAFFTRRRTHDGCLSSYSVKWLMQACASESIYNQNLFSLKTVMCPLRKFN